MSTARPRFRPGLEGLEDRTTPAFLRIVPATDGGIDGYGTAGTDPNNPSATNTELVPASQLTVPYGPRELGLVTSPVRASSILNLTASPPAGLFPTLGSSVPDGRLVFDLYSQAQKGGGLNGGGTTIFTYGLDPNVTLAPLTIEVVPEVGEQTGQAVTLSFGFQATASPAGADQTGIRQDAGLTFAGNRTSLLSRNIQAGDPASPLTGGQDFVVHVGDKFGFDFTQLASLAGIVSGTAAAHMVLGLAVGSVAPGAGVVGAGVRGGPAVKQYASDGSLARSFLAFEPSFTGGVRVATGDLNHDGVADIVAGTGPGRTAEVRVFDGKTGAEVFRTQPFGDFTGGVFVAAGDVTGDGFADLAVTPDEGGGPRVRVFSGNGFAPMADFFGIEDPNFRGGARVAMGDINRDGRADVVVAAGFGGGPRVSVWDGTALAGGNLQHPFGDFFVFEQGLRNGTFVAVGDLDGDGYGDIIAGGGPGGGPRVLALGGQDLLAGRTTPLANFFAGPDTERNGVPVAATNLDNDTRADLLTGTGAGSGARVRAYLGSTIAPAAAPPEYRDFNPFPGLTGGVFVG